MQQRLRARRVVPSTTKSTAAATSASANGRNSGASSAAYRTPMPAPASHAAAQKGHFGTAAQSKAAPSVEAVLLARESSGDTAQPALRGYSSRSWTQDWANGSPASSRPFGTRSR